jgi:hypothetical protein
MRRFFCGDTPHPESRRGTPRGERCAGAARTSLGAPNAAVRRVVLWTCLMLMGCAAGARAAVRLSVERAASTPRDASVYIDEQFVGFLGVVAARGVKLPEGEHRITVEKVGYFPWDEQVVSDRKPITLKVELRKVPD